jgi:hypothetical protein
MQPNQGPPSLPPPMWCPDPADTNRLRWWDGSRWTDQYAQIPAPVLLTTVEDPASRDG